jgi:Xaa-Pro aminopeptidase
VREVRTKHTDLDSWLGFERLTCVPIQMRMVLEDMLNNEEKEWLIQHNRTCLEALEGFLHDDERAVRWLHREADGIGVAPAPGSNADWN